MCVFCTVLPKTFDHDCRLTAAACRRHLAFALLLCVSHVLLLGMGGFVGGHVAASHVRLADDSGPGALSDGACTDH